MADISAESAGKTRPTRPRTVQVLVRFTEEGADLLDKLRGSKSRQEYVRDLVKADYVAAKKAGRL